LPQDFVQAVYSKYQQCFISVNSEMVHCSYWIIGNLDLISA